MNTYADAPLAVRALLAAHLEDRTLRHQTSQRPTRPRTLTDLPGANAMIRTLTTAAASTLAGTLTAATWAALTLLAALPAQAHQSAGPTALQAVHTVQAATHQIGPWPQPGPWRGTPLQSCPNGSIAPVGHCPTPTPGTTNTGTPPTGTHH